MHEKHYYNSYLFDKYQELRYQRDTLDDKVEENGLIWIILNGFGPSWHHFVQFVCAHEKLPSIESLWDAFIEEKMRLEMVSTSDEDVPKLDLIGRVSKGGNKIGFVKG